MTDQPKGFAYYGYVENPVCPCCKEVLKFNVETIKVFVVCTKCNEVLPTDTRAIETKH